MRLPVRATPGLLQVRAACILWAAGCGGLVLVVAEGVGTTMLHNDERDGARSPHVGGKVSSASTHHSPPCALPPLPVAPSYQTHQRKLASADRAAAQWEGRGQGRGARSASQRWASSGAADVGSILTLRISVGQNVRAVWIAARGVYRERHVGTEAGRRAPPLRSFEGRKHRRKLLVLGRRRRRRLFGRWQPLLGRRLQLAAQVDADLVQHLPGGGEGRGRATRAELLAP